MEEGLRCVGTKAGRRLDTPFPLVPGRGDEAAHGGGPWGPDSREPKALTVRPRDMYQPDLHIDTLKVKARNFR
jgi:error-prone DNA polymerase